MKWLRNMAWLSLWIVTCVAAAPTYTLNCVPDSTDLTLVERIKMRLDLHGWLEAQGNAGYRLCFRQLERQQIYVDPAPFLSDPFSRYWGSPVPRVVTVPYLELILTREDGSMQQFDQDMPQTNGAALDQSVRLLIDHLPLE